MQGRPGLDSRLRHEGHQNDPAADQNRNKGIAAVGVLLLALGSSRRHSQPERDTEAGSRDKAEGQGWINLAFAHDARENRGNRIGERKHRVAGVHQRPAMQRFQLAHPRIHNHIEKARCTAERQHRQGKANGRCRQSWQNEYGDKSQRRHLHGACAEHTVNPRREPHGRHQAQRRAKEQDAKGRIIDTEPILEHRIMGRHRAPVEADDDESGRGPGGGAKGADH